MKGGVLGIYLQAKPGDWGSSVNNRPVSKF